MLAVAEAEEGMENAPEVDNMLVAEGLEPVPETERLAFQLPPRACQQAWSARHGKVRLSRFETDLLLQLWTRWQLELKLFFAHRHRLRSDRS